MSYDRLRNAQAEAANVAAAAFARPTKGIVTSYDKDSYCAKVKFQPPPDEGDAIESGWLPIRALQIGNGYGVLAAPAIGDQVTVEFIDGNIDCGEIVGATFSDVDRPPAVPEGEIWVVHKTGSFLKFTTDGKILSKGPWEHDGTLHAKGNISSEADITDHTAADGSGGVSMKKHRDAYNGAKYQVIAVGSPTSTTDHPAT